MCKYCDNGENLADRVQELTEQGWQNTDIGLSLGQTTQTIIQIKARHHIRRKRTAGGGYVVGRKVELMGERCRDCGAMVSEPCPVPRCIRYMGEITPEDRTLAGVVGVL